MGRGRIKRQRQWVRLGLILLPLAVFSAFAAGATAPVAPEQTPFTVTLNKHLADEQVHYQLLVRADRAQVHIANTVVVAHIRNSIGFSAVHTLPLNADDDWHWRLSPQEPARYRIDLEVSGQNLQGESMRMTLDSHYFQFPEPGDPYISPEERALNALAQGLDEAQEQIPLAPLPAYDEPLATDAPPPSQNAMDAVTRVMVYGGVLAANLVVLALLVFGYQMIKNSRREDDLQTGPEETEPEQSGTPSPPMQDIGSEDDNDPDSDSDPDNPEPVTDASAAAQPAPDPLIVTETVTEAAPESDIDEPLFPLDDDNWASTELNDSDPGVTPESGPDKP